MEKNWDYLNESLVGIIAPAGYGKTEEIAEAVHACDGKQLILTHTRAGVAALRDRMKRKKVCPDKYEIDTIASFCLKWCKAYPSTAQVQIPKKMNEINYQDIYKGTGKVFSHYWAKLVLEQTYAGIFVDEYQDCTESQHEVFMMLENLIPIRIFGDPLQGIFYWVKDDKIVNWNSFSFKVITPLTTPWRWEKTNKELGKLLDNLRRTIIVVLEGKSVTINIADVPGCMTIINTSKWNNGSYAYRIKNYNSVVYLSVIPNKQKSFSQHNGGYFQCDERKDLAEAEEIIAAIESYEKEKKALVFLEKMKIMVNGIQGELKSYINNLNKGKSDFSRISKHKELGKIIENICSEDSPQPVLEALRWFERSEDFKIYRKELFYRIGKIYAHMVEEKTSLYEAVEALSSQRYFSEKRFNFPRLSSRTVLTKGLEFDCVIIDARDKMDVRDFYVAMTRAKKHIYIISDAKQLSFSGVQY